MRDRLLQRVFWETATLDQVRERLQGEAAATLKCPDTGANPLHFACEQCTDPDVIQVLIDHGCDVNMQDWWWLAAPLHDAAKHNESPEVIHTLVKAGADVNVTNRSGQTPLHLAAGHNNADVASALIELGANINAQDSRGFTPLHYSAIHRHDLEHAAMLITLGADENAIDANGRTPLEAREDYGWTPAGLLAYEAALRRPRTIRGSSHEAQSTA